MLDGLVTAASAAAVTTTATTAAAEAAATAATAAFSLGAGFIDVEGAAVEVFAVEAGDGRLAFGLRAHFDKAETLGAVRHFVDDYARAAHLTIGLELRAEVVLGGVVGKVAYVDVHVLFPCLGTFAFGSRWFRNLDGIGTKEERGAGMHGLQNFGRVALRDSNKDVNMTPHQGLA